MQQVDSITFTFEDNGRLHDDLVLRIRPERWRCDSYYLWCEGPRADTEHAPVVRDVLARLINRWMAAIHGLQSGQSCFLPFDFADQSTGWLRCTSDGADLIVWLGWSEIEGWSVSPAKVGAWLVGVPDFEADWPPVRIGRADLLRSLDERPASR